MSSYQKARVPVRIVPTPLKLRPAERRQYLLEMMRARVKATPGYDRAGLKATKTLVEHVRTVFGKTVPDSLRGEPNSLGTEFRTVGGAHSDLVAKVLTK